MLSSRLNLKLSTLVFFWVLTQSISADTIILKDGTTEESDKVWETERFIHFILKGTRSVEIRYAKEIVARIERTSPRQPIRSNASASPPAEKPLQPSAPPGDLPPAPSTESAPLDQASRVQIAGENRGISFYDPRRAQRYWSSRNSKHTTLEKALEMLAYQYGRSVKWVEEHMGEENDLGAIHANLSRSIAAEEKAGQTASMAGPAHPGGTKGDPRQLPNSRIPIHVDPHADKAFPSPEPATDPASRDVAPQDQPLADMPKGVPFYDPRRLKKYWVGQNSRHSTLQQALQALAGQYGVSVEWIEAHLGDTNDIAEIHRNIKESLRKQSKELPAK